VRLQTLDEIKQHAIEQVAAGGPSALSLNAIAKAMGMSGPAIYRYFASREQLLAALVTDGYAELAAVVQDASAAAARRRPERRLAHVADAYRQWARANPYRYELLFSVRPPGYSDPGEAIAAIEPAMQVLLELLGTLAADGGASPATGTTGPRDELEPQLRRWATARSRPGAAGQRAPDVLLLGVLTWTRLHGIVMLELAGVLGDMGLDPALLVKTELDAVVTAATSR
jgi:AcrR family transcriptional regulator